MVVVMVGMNYKLKERNKSKGDEKERNEQQVINTSSVSFTEGRGTFSTLFSTSHMHGGRKIDV